MMKTLRYTAIHVQTVSHNFPHKISETNIFKKMWTTNKVSFYCNEYSNLFTMVYSSRVRNTHGWK